METNQISRFIAVFLVVYAVLGGVATGVEVRSCEPVKIVDRCGRGMLLDAGGQRVLLVAGSPYEMGYQQGKLLTKECRAITDKILSFARKEEASGRKDFLKAGSLDEALARSGKFIDRRYYEEMRGLADGAGIDVGDVELVNIFPELFHCSGFALFKKATKDGKLLHGRILDYTTTAGLQDYAVVTVAKPDGYNAFVTVGYAGFIGSVTGMNDKQISVGEMGGDGGSDWDGMPMSFLMRKVLEEADTLDEAVGIFENTPRTCEYFYVVSDGKAGDARGLACWPDKCLVMEPGKSYKLLPEGVEDTVLVSAGERYKNLVGLVRKNFGKIDVDTALAIMDRPVAMKSCLHRVLFSPQSGMLWVANAAPVSEHKYQACYQPYYSFDFNGLLAMIPEKGSEPAAMGLRVSDNGRFLVDSEGKGFFPVADTAWAIAWKLDRSDVEKYLNRRCEQKFNTVAMVAFPSYEGHNTILANAYGDNPFELKAGRWDPLRPIVTAGDNPKNTAEYDYWDHLDYIIDSAADRGMYVVLLPAWGGSVAGDYGSGRVTDEIIFDSASAYRYGHWIGSRLADRKNVIWMLGGDRSAVYGKRDYREVFRAMAEGITDGVNGVDQQDGKADYSATLMSYHPKKWAPNSSQWFHNDAWLDFNSIQDMASDQLGAIANDYGLTPAKPTWLFEGRYEYAERGEGMYKDWQVRFQSYQTVFAGGFGITYGSMNVFDFHKGLAALEETGAKDMQYLASLMVLPDNSQFLDRIPDQSLVAGDAGKLSGGEGIRSNRIQATRGGRGDYAMVYAANGRNFRLKMDRLAVPAVDGFWFNPRNGKWRVGGDEFVEQKAFETGIAAGEDSPVREFDPPDAAGDGNDWVLVLMAPKQ